MAFAAHHVAAASRRADGVDFGPCLEAMPSGGTEPWC